MDTLTIIQESQPTKKVNISLRQLIDIDETGGIVDDNITPEGKIKNNQILTGFAELIDPETRGKVKSFRFKNLSSLIQGGTGITISTDKDGITTISASGGSGSTSTVKHLVKLAQNISKGQAVYVTGATGTNILVSKADYTTEATSSKVIGLLETGGVTNDQVNVVTEGLLAGVNTITATIGDPVWLGASGNLIFGLVNKPYAPYHLVYIGVVTRVHAVNGEIFVQPQNGFELKEIHDVQLVNQKDGEAIIYDATSGLWKNTDIEALMIAYSVAL